MKKIFISLVLLLFIIFSLLNFEHSIQSSYSRDADVRLERFIEEISSVIENFPEGKILSLQRNGRVSRGLIMDIKVSDIEKSIKYIHDELLKNGFSKKNGFFCRDLEYIDFSLEKLSNQNIILYWHYPDERC